MPFSDVKLQVDRQKQEDLLRTNIRLTEENHLLKTENQWLKEQFNLARQQRFGASSEQSSITALEQQALIFNEAEFQATPSEPEPTVETSTSRRSKTKGQREAQFAKLDVEEVPYALPEDQQICPICSGALHDMGPEVRKEFKFVPAHLIAVHHVQHKYSCRHCEKEGIPNPIVMAAMPTHAFPNSAASPSAVAHIATEKFVMGSPLYRLEQQFDRQGIDISRQTMANWMIKGAEWLKQMTDRLHELLLTNDILHADETPLQVLREGGRDAQTKSMMWLYLTSREVSPIILFDYQTTREGEHPRRFLKGFEGHLHVDGYAGYDGIPRVTLVGCWTHARRKFDEALKALPEAARLLTRTPAHQGLDFCNKLYRIEHDLKDATPQERFDGRNERSRPILEEFHTWLKTQVLEVLPKSALGTAIAYCLRQWKKLLAYLLDGRLEIDNNRSERSIRPFVMGRKNWLFANTPQGAKASAIIYSIVETAKANGIDPFAYMTWLFEKLPNIDGRNSAELDQLLPWSEKAQALCRPRPPLKT